MGIAYDYLVRQHSKAYADAIELDRVNTDIAGMEAQLEKVTKDLAGAKQYAVILKDSIAVAHQLVEDTCGRNEWPLPETPATPPAPAPIGDHITRETTGTLAFEALKVAIPGRIQGDSVDCCHPDCGMELMHENGLWLHCNTGKQMCEPPAPVLQEGTDGDPLKRTVLPPHIAAEVADHG